MNSTPTTVSPMVPALESVLCTEELNRRPARPPDHERENRALVSLAQALAASPRTILQTLADTILKVLPCDSGGVSLVTEDGTRFHWPAIAGVWKPHLGGGTPRDFGPCGDVLDRNCPLLFSHFERRYTYLQPVMPPAVECLLVPLSVEGKAIGTIWAITHDDWPGTRKFDSEDLRMLVSLGTFASAAYQAVEQLHSFREQTHERQDTAQALREMNQALLVSSVRQHELAEQAQNAETAMRNSETRYRRLFESAKDGILILDAHTGKITDANACVGGLMETETHELLGKELWELGLLKHEQASQEAFHALQQTGSIRYEDLPLESKSGTLREVEFVSNLYQENGRRVIQCNIRDITERKRADNALRESEAQLRAIFDGSLDGIVMADDEGRYVEANPSACGLFGLSKEELLGRRVPDFAEPGFPFDQAWQTFRRNGRSQGEFRLVRPDGTARDLEFAATADVLPGRHVSILRDVTERKRLEEEAKRHEQELVEADHRKDEFLAMLGHELRNPLAPIRNALQLVRLSIQEPRQEVRQAYDIIERQVENLVRLVDDLLDVGRITSGKIQLQTERIDLATVVARAVEGARPLIDARRHSLEVNLPEAPVPVQADPVRLAQVLWNLLNNAAKYTPDGGRITLEVERGNEAVVRIRDTGMGIAPEMLPRVFDLFTQLERTLARAEGGLGLGLTLVRRLTEMHGGTVAATSAGQGQGCEFVVRLPVLPEEAPTVRPARPAAERRVVPASGRRILVVDDNRDSAESLAMLLRLFGNDVRTVQDGWLALEVAAAYHPDVVLLDIGLPGLDGLEVCRRLRARTGEGQPLIVAMTGYGQEEDRRRSEEAGFDAHMVKPVDLGALQELLSRPELTRHGPQGTRKESAP